MYNSTQNETSISFRGLLVISVVLINAGFPKWKVIADTCNVKGSMKKMNSNEHSVWSLPDRVLTFQKVEELPWIWLINETPFPTLTSISA